MAALSALAMLGMMSVNPVSAAETRLYGDVNNNQVVDITDLSLLSLHLVGDTKFDDSQKDQMDFDRDGKCDIVDLATLRSFISHSLQIETVIGTPMPEKAVVTEPVVTTAEPAATVTDPVITDAPITETPVTEVTTTVTTAETTVTTTEAVTTTVVEEPKEVTYYACDGEIYRVLPKQQTADSLVLHM